MTDITDLTQIIKRGRIRAPGNEVITAEFSAKLGGAHGSYLGTKGVVVVSREYNNLNRMIKRSYIGGVMGAGVDLLNLHSAPVPVLQFCIRRFGANGGAFFSTGSSLEGESTIRFFDSAGVEYNIKNLESVNEHFKSDKINRVNPNHVGTLTDIPATQDIYKKSIPKFIDRSLFKDRKLQIVVDCSYGPTSVTIPTILSDLNIDVIAINSYESDRQTAESFPNLNSIKNSVNIVKASGADLGVVLDPDGSRALFITDQGTILNYEELMMFFIHYDKEISKSKGRPIITSQSASKVLTQFVESENFEVIRSENFPGEISRSLREERAAFGGADTLKFYFPQYGPFSDATFTTLKILEILARHDMPLSSLVRTFPRTILAYKTIPIKEDGLKTFNNDIKSVIKENSEHDIDYQDIILGIKLIKHGVGWVMITPSIHSNTIELTAETIAKNDHEKSEELIELAEKYINELNK